MDEVVIQGIIRSFHILKSDGTVRLEIEVAGEHREKFMQNIRHFDHLLPVAVAPLNLPRIPDKNQYAGKLYKSSFFVSPPLWKVLFNDEGQAELADKIKHYQPGEVRDSVKEALKAHLGINSLSEITESMIEDFCKTNKLTRTYELSWTSKL